MGEAAVTGGVAERVTLTHVAEHAGVSRATASLVLRDSPLVAEATRLRVRAAMQSLGYVYHRGAASLRSQRSHTVGLVINDITNPFFAELTVGVEAALDRAGHIALLANTDESLEKQDRLLAAINEYNADGVLLCPAEGTGLATLERLHTWRLPCVLLTRYLLHGEVDYVGADNMRGAEEGTRHLLAHGHRRIAFVGGAPSSSARRDRLQGYVAALRAAAIPIDEMLLPTCVPTRAGGHEALARLLALPDPPTAALCYNDVVAFGAMLALQAAGLTPGRHFAVIGFDDIADAALWHPSLTTLSIAPRRVGARAADLLLERIADPSAPPRREILAPTLVVRDSCGGHHGGE